eukprot:365660-Chlamydomonas_euryale.AAC.13
MTLVLKYRRRYAAAGGAGSALDEAYSPVADSYIFAIAGSAAKRPWKALSCGYGSSASVGTPSRKPDVSKHRAPKSVKSAYVSVEPTQKSLPDMLSSLTRLSSRALSGPAAISLRAASCSSGVCKGEGTREARV